MQKKVSLAVVDDDLDLQELIQTFFRARDFEVHSYDDAEVLLGEIERSGANFDVIITDLNLPGMSGLEFTQRLKELKLMTPVILVTAYKSSEIAVQAIEAGAYDFVVKPIHFPQLQVSVERAIYLNRLHSENESLKSAVAASTNFGGIVGKNPLFRHALDIAKRVADSPANVFITGETGSGKEVIARAIHQAGKRSSSPFVAINCSAIPENLLESELFGHARGSFTGANEKRIGLFEEAGNGTLFLDEIGDLQLPLQSKLLRVLQERKIKRIGENQLRPINCRIISATHKNLKIEIKKKRFREDLFFRLNVIPIHIPPLRERPEDIIPLAEFFLRKFSALYNKDAKRLQKSVLETFLRNPWKGNVRELENTVERGVALSEGPCIELEDLIIDDANAGDEELSSRAPMKEDLSNFFKTASEESGNGENLLTLDALTKRYILYALKKNNGVKDKTAKELAIDRKTLYRRIRELEAEQANSSPTELHQ